MLPRSKWLLMIFAALGAAAGRADEPKPAWQELPGDWPTGLIMKRRRKILWRAAVLLAVCTTAWAEEPVSTRSDQSLLDAYGDPLPPDALLRFGTTRFHHQAWICDAAIAPDGRMLASAAVNQDVGIALWEIPSGRLLDRLMPAGDRPPWTQSLAFSPDGKKLLTGDIEGSVRVWSLVTIHYLSGAIASDRANLALESDAPGGTGSLVRHFQVERQAQVRHDPERKRRQSLAKVQGFRPGFKRYALAAGDGTIGRGIEIMVSLTGRRNGGLQQL